MTPFNPAEHNRRCAEAEGGRAIDAINDGCSWAAAYFAREAFFYARLVLDRDRTPIIETFLRTGVAQS